MNTPEGRNGAAGEALVDEPAESTPLIDTTEGEALVGTEEPDDLTDPRFAPPAGGTDADPDAEPLGTQD